MPKKIDHGPATRHSRRLTQSQRSPSEEPVQVSGATPSRTEESVDEASTTPDSTEPETPAIPHRNTEPETPVASVEVDERSEEEYDSAPEPESSGKQDTDPLEEAAGTQLKDKQPATPSRQTSTSRTMAPSDDADPTVAQLLRRIQQLEEANNSNDNNDRRTRAVTPANSAFGGNDFKPTGFAALPSFKPYGQDQLAANPDYDKKARESRFDPGKFDGDKDKFGKWIVKLSDKCRKDNDTFKVERDRMALVFTCLEDKPANLLEARYGSTEIPFKSTAEMVATLSAVYHDAHQSARARAKLATMMYDPADKEMDIHQFIGEVNSLADKAGVPKDQRKVTLQEHVPAYLGNELFTRAIEPDVSYEAYCATVAGAALNQQRAFQERRAFKQQTKRDRSPQEPPRRRSFRRTDRSKDKQEPRREASDQPRQDKNLTSPDEKDALKGAGLCFVCKKAGHLARDCPDRKTLANMLAQLDQEDSENSAGSDTGSIPSTSDSEN